MKQIKVLCLFDYNCFTGFASVSKNLMQNWKKQLGAQAQFDIVAINYFGDPYTEEDGTRIISAKLTDNQKDDFGRYTFLKSVLDNDYDVLFILQDLGVTIGLVPHLKKFKEEKRLANKPNFKSILYFPVDSTLVPNLCVGLEFFDVLATYTEFGRKEVLIQRPDLKGKVKVVPHGTNTKDFFLMPEIEIQVFRNRYFGSNSDKFIVTNINRNQPRKDIPTTIFGFLEYKNQFNENAFLYLHMNPKDPLGWDLRRVMQQTPLIEGVDYMFPSEEDYNKGASVETLNKIYNASDCFITTATGGGWELTVTEAMATCTPVIMPRHTSFGELGGANGERCYYLEELSPDVHNIDNIIRWKCNIHEIAEVISQVDKDKRSNALDQTLIKEKALKFVKSLDWHSISKGFSDDIKRLG
jgi:glycosyltransferase involved in cell wall biosynthesis